MLGKLVSVFHRPLLKYTKEKAVTGSSQHGFVKGKSSLTNVIDFYVKMTSSVDEIEWWILFILTLVSLSTRQDNCLVQLSHEQAGKVLPHKWTVRQTENWLKTQRIMINGNISPAGGQSLEV